MLVCRPFGSEGKVKVCASCSRPGGAAGAGGGAAEGAVPRPGRGAQPGREAGDPAGAAEGGPRGQLGGVGGALQDHAAAAAGDAGRQRRKDAAPAAAAPLSLPSAFKRDSSSRSTPSEPWRCGS